MQEEGRSPTLGLFAGLEAATGLGLLLRPDLVIGLLFGLAGPAPEALLLARLSGAALLAIGVIGWGSRVLHGSRGDRGLLIGILLYNGLAAAVLAHAALGLNLQGVLIWPATLYHAAMLAWCLVIALRMRRR